MIRKEAERKIPRYRVRSSEVSLSDSNQRLTIKKAHMQTKKKHLLIITLFLGLTGLLSCNKKLVEVDPSNPAPETVWTTPGGFVTNVNGAYSFVPFLYGNDENGLFLSEPGTDLWYNYNKTAYDADLTQNQNLTTGSNPCKSVWTTMYAGINLCNAGIGRINGAGFTNPVEMN